MFGGVESAFKALVDKIHDRKRDAEARGWVLEMVVLPRSWSNTLNRAVLLYKPSGDVYSIVGSGRGCGEYILGVKILWSEKRLPPNQVWWRYKGDKK